MRASPVLEAGDGLQKNAVDPVSQARFIPLSFARVFLALVQKQGFEMVRGDGLASNVEVAVTQGFEGAETLPPAAAL